MKKTIFQLVSVAFLIGLITSCGSEKEINGDEEISHKYSDAFEKDGEYHWHKCTDKGYEDLISEKIAHVWDEESHTHVDSTCTVKGFDLDVCKDCGYLKKVDIDLVDHNYVAVKGEECYMQCSKCGAQTEHKSHDYGEPVVTEATYEHAGHSDKTCKNCGKTVSETIEKLEHHYEGIASDDDYHWTPCTDAGYETIFINKEAHNYVVDMTETVVPTCLNEGTTKMVCSVCEHVKRIHYDQLDHQYGSYSTDETGHWLTCINCSSATTVQSHIFVVNQGMSCAPSCAAEGKTVEICSVCSYVKETTIDKLAHTYIHDDVLSYPATCTEEGASVETCIVCNDHKSTPITKLAHNYVYDETNSRPATCQEDGVRIEKCTECPAFISTTLEKIDHNHVTLSDKNNHWEGCSMCGLVYGSKTAHNFNYHTQELSTCKHHGYELDICGDCHYEKRTELPLAEHDYAQKYNEESHWLECKVCGDYKDKTLHSLTIHTHQDATCTEDGFDRDACACGYYTETIIPSPGGHDYQLSKDETNHWTTCSRCSDETERIPHNYIQDVSTQSTCQTQGYVKSICGDCGYEKIVYKDLVGHSSVRKFDSNQHWHECRWCGAITEEKQNHNLISDGPSAKKCTDCGFVCKI